jgi:tetratricopeptide (TPR) repeat protein
MIGTNLLSAFFKRLALSTGAIMVSALAAGLAFGQVNPKAEDLYRRTEYRASLALLDPGCADGAVNNLIGRDYFMMGDFKKATDYFQKAVQSNPENADFALWLGRGWGRRAETSNPLFAPGYAAKTRQWLERAVALDGRHEEALSDLFDYYLEAPGFLGGGYDKAEVMAGKIAEVDPAEGYFARAQLAEKRSQYSTAELQFRHAVELAPKQVGRVIDLAKFLATQGRNQESDALFAKAEQMAPNAPKLWYARADTLIKTKRNPAEAKRLLEKYLSASITPDDPSKNDANRLLRQISGA